MSLSTLLRTAIVSSAVLSIPCVPCAVMCAQAPQPAATFTASDYVGTWHLMFQGNAFATLIVQQNGDQLSGSLTGVSITMDDNGRLTKAVATGAPSSTLHVSFANGVLHVSEKDGDDDLEWTMTLSSPKAGELRFAGGAPASAEAIRVEKLWSEPPVQP